MYYVFNEISLHKAAVLLREVTNFDIILSKFVIWIGEANLYARKLLLRTN